MRVGRIIMGVLYVSAGLLHFAIAPAYERIVPDYLPAHHALVLVSGVAEIAGGLGMLYAPTRRSAAWGIILLLIAVFPANLWMVQHPQLYPRIPVWALWSRLPLQLVLIAWAWRYTQPDSAKA